MTTVRPIRDARLGTVLRDTWRLESVLGRGATGSVYRAVHVRTGQLAAVKVLREGGGLLDTAETVPPGDEAGDGELSARRFAREARIARSLDHPNIVKVYAFEEAAAPGEAYIAMELLDGEPLSRLLKRRPLTPAEALALYRPLCDAMGYAHEMGVVHRDLKPDNVFLVGGSPGDPRVLDFGISKMLQPDASQLTTDAILGTPAYMAPELVRNPAGVDRRTDIFALGAMLFHALTGHLPFEGDTVLAVFHKVLMGRPPSARHFRPELSPALDEVLMRAMARSAGERYQSAGELLAALTAAARAAPGDVHQPAPTALMPTIDALTAPEPPPAAVARTLMMPQLGPEPAVGEAPPVVARTGELPAPPEAGAQPVTAGWPTTGPQPTTAAWPTTGPQPTTAAWPTTGPQPTAAWPTTGPQPTAAWPATGPQPTAWSEVAPAGADPADVDLRGRRLDLGRLLPRGWWVAALLGGAAGAILGLLSVG